MLNLYITKSKIRQDLLTLFFTNPSQRYYLREIQRILGHSAGTIRRELLRFREDSLFTTKINGSLLYYSLNRKHPLFDELKSIISKTTGMEGSLKKALLLLQGISFAFIYGSFASRKEKSASDIDLMVIGNPDASLLNEKIAQSENKLKREINHLVYSLEEYKAKKKAKSGFIMDILNNPKIMLIGQENEL